MQYHNSTKRVLDILITVSQHKEGLSLTEISNILDLPKSTISPILRTLLDMNFLMQEKNSNLHKIGLSALLISASYLSSSNGMELIKAELDQIIAACNEVCNVGVLDGDKVLFIMKSSGNEPIKLMSKVGNRLPLHCTALGKALLSDKSYEEIKALLTEPLEIFTPHTIADTKSLYEQIQSYKKEGLFYETEEITEFARCIAVPLKNGDQIIGALSISFPTFRADEEKVAAIKKLLKKYSYIIERIMIIYELNG